MMRTLRILYLTLFGGLLSACAVSPDPQNSDPTPLSGSGLIDMDKLPDIGIPVWYHVPADIDAATSPIVIVMHGTNRDADRYRDEWRPLAEAEDFIVIVPEFSREDWPRSAGYNLGNVRADGRLNPRSDWSYSRIEPLFDEIVARLGSTQQGYGLYGHSAGSQFVHRFVYHVPDHRAKSVISANAGWYTLPEFESDWPYGLAGSTVTRADRDAALEGPMTILLGNEDNDPDHKSLRRTPEAMIQGPHRFARGQTMYQIAKNTAADRNLDFGWSLEIVNGAEHRNDQMSKAAAPLLTAQLMRD